MTIYKIPVSIISCINIMAKQQGSLKGLKFRDRQNHIDYLISTGVYVLSSQSGETGDLSEVV